MDRLSTDHGSFDWDGIPDDDELTLTEEDYAPEPPPSPVGQDDRRLQVRAYSYWASLLGSRTLPSTDDLDLTAVEDFATNSVLLDFSEDPLDPRVRHLGSLLAAECGAESRIESLADVPARSLLSRITAHYMQILANRAPIGFEAEFVNAAGAQIMYRGILMPFSRDDEDIDSILGVINWKEALGDAGLQALQAEMRQAMPSASASGASPAQRVAAPVASWADGPIADQPVPQNSDAELPNEERLPAGLHDCLASARALADRASRCDDRSRAALYEAVGRAYDVSLAAAAEPEAWTQIVGENGLKVQDRAPMTPVVKLVFGLDYDKTRLTEYAAALSYAHRRAMPAGTLGQHLQTAEGGLKGVVKDERQARREENGKASEGGEAARRLRLPRRIEQMPGRPLAALDAAGAEFGLVMIRRTTAGEVVLLGEISEDATLVERAARRLAKQA